MEVVLLLQRPGRVRMKLAARLVLPLCPVPLSIEMPHPEDERDGVQDCPKQKAKDNGMAFDKARWRVVDMRPHDGEALPEDFRHGPCCTTLGEAASVDAKPRYE